MPIPLPFTLAVALASACLLQGCASPPAAPAWTLEPVQRIENSPGQSAETWFELGKFYQQRDQLQMAAEAWRTSLALEPRQLAARNALAVLDARAGRLEQAVTALLALVEEYPQSAQPLGNLGYMYYLQGQLVQAASTLEQAVLLGGDVRLARNNLQLVRAALASQSPPPASASAVQAANAAKI